MSKFREAFICQFQFCFYFVCAAQVVVREERKNHKCSRCIGEVQDLQNKRG
jgi:hypothetical protein